MEIPVDNWNNSKHTPSRRVAPKRVVKENQQGEIIEGEVYHGVSKCQYDEINWSTYLGCEVVVISNRR